MSMYQSTFLANYRATLKALSKRRNLLFKECPQFIDQIITFITKLYELDIINSKGYTIIIYLIIWIIILMKSWKIYFIKVICMV